MIKLRPHQERIVTNMTTNPKGQVIVPTGGGKTLCMIKDAQRVFNSGNKWGFLLKQPDRKTIVVVSPRILLAQQHCDEFEEFLGLHPKAEIPSFISLILYSEGSDRFPTLILA